MSTPHVLKGWTTREWQKALELAYAVEGEDPEMHVVGGTYVEVGRNAQGPYVEVNSADSKGRDLRVRRVYMKPKPTGEAKHNAAPGASEAPFVVRFHDQNRRVTFLKNSGAFTHDLTEAKRYKRLGTAEARAERIAEDNHGVFSNVTAERYAPTVREPRAKFKIGDRVSVKDTSIRGRVTYVGQFDSFRGQRFYKVTDDDPRGSRKTWYEDKLRKLTTRAKPNHKLRRTKAACSLRGRQTRLGNGSAASHLATHCPPLGVRKGNKASSWKVIVLGMGRPLYSGPSEKKARSAYASARRSASRSNSRIYMKMVSLLRDGVAVSNSFSDDGVRKSNDAAPKVRVLSMKKKTRTIRGVSFNSYDVNLMVGNQFVTIEADANRYPVLPESISDGPTREAILHAVQHYRSGR
jgi:hypothetical protein